MRFTTGCDVLAKACVYVCFCHYDNKILIIYRVSWAHGCSKQQPSSFSISEIEWLADRRIHNCMLPNTRAQNRRNNRRLAGNELTQIENARTGDSCMKHFRWNNVICCMPATRKQNHHECECTTVWWTQFRKWVFIWTRATERWVMQEADSWKIVLIALLCASKQNDAVYLSTNAVTVNGMTCDYRTNFPFIPEAYKVLEERSNSPWTSWAN